MEPPSPDEVMQFPCDYPLKVMGFAEGPFRESALEIIERHVPDLDVSKIQTRESRGGKYISLTVPFTATSREQLDALYQDLSDCEAVSVAL